MRTIRSFLIAAAFAATSVFVAWPAASDPIVCHEYSCCEDVEILGKTIIPIDC